jgi:1,4-alpha-glucan branching enzyme
VWDLDYLWNDESWMKERNGRNHARSPMAIYEVHIGSWMRIPGEENRFLSYREMAPRLAEYVKRMGFTHVEFLPVMEHPFYGSWGYESLGYFAPTSRYGTPQDLMFLIDTLHQHGIGVILDWVPSHFPSDEHGLAFFDGTHLYEHFDARQRIQPDWGSSPQLRPKRGESLLISRHVGGIYADGLRVDAVASMLYLVFQKEESSQRCGRKTSRRLSPAFQ